MPMEYENLFPLYWICGEWKSNRKSPPVTVFRDGGAYRIALIYHLDAVVVNWRTTFPRSWMRGSEGLRSSSWGR